MTETDSFNDELHAQNQQLQQENAALKRKLQQLNDITMAHADAVYRMNADWSNILELNAPDFLAASDEQDALWMERYIAAEDQPRVRQAIRKAIDTKSMFELEVKVIQANGEEGAAISRAIPVLDEAGNVTEWIGLASNITDRKKTEQELMQLIEETARQQRMYETITGNTPDLVYVFDLDGRISYANEALLKMWGRSKEESFGKSLIELGYEPWHAAMHEREIAHISKAHEIVRGEVAFPHATLGKRTYDYILVPVFDADGNVSAVAGTTRDITEIRNLLNQKDEFLGIASHELKTPLTSIKAYGQVLQNIFGSRNDEETVMVLRRMDNQINKLTGLINDLLDVTRIQSGKLQFNENSFDLTELALDIIDGVELTTNKHIITKQFPEKLLFFGDMERIGQVITNLLTNAIKYSPAGGEVNCKLEDQPDQILLTVQDFGLGIPKGMQTKVFEQFFRANNYRHVISGMGIGLYISAEIVQRSGGKIWVESTEGKGSTFFVSLPKRTAEQPL
jgi:PAS domain S-box-containing protein